MIAGKIRHGGIWLFLFLGVGLGAFAQQRKKEDLQKERQKNIERIRETEKILDETSKEKKSSIGELTALNKRIEQQETLITSTKNEIGLLDNDIDEDNQIIEAMQKDVNALKEEYAAMLFAAQKASGKINKLTFLFSAQTVDQLLMRLKYMRQYGQARQEQTQAIGKAQTLLSEQVKQTELKRSEKKTLLEDEVNQSTHLVKLKKKQRNVVSNLEKEEKQLKRELEQTKKAVAELDDLIAKIVKEELERAARERSKNKGKEVIASDESVALSSSFEENKSKFPWPVSGFVSQHFGRQMHPVLRGIEVQNDGVNIQTKANEPVRAIFTGRVSRIAFIRGIGNTIILSHGEYFSVYSGLKDVFVKPGQKVSVNEELGRVLTTAEGISELRFQVRKNIVALDPQQWLKNGER
ncbi:MAG: peptidoglycan DD-metalloendopeptidase family protein [Bacteroidetes bacterium]|nr:peptidoglycan DD-metalloendopeptidase family protein [Bacteroidota bacterium]